MFVTYRGGLRCHSLIAWARGIRRNLGQAEVENLGVTAIGHEDIRGLDVAMDNAAGVGRVESIRDLDA